MGPKFVIHRWTTDAEVAILISTLGIEDLVEVKFHENRTNGQSKGFCSVFFRYSLIHIFF